MGKRYSFTSYQLSYIRTKHRSRVSQGEAGDMKWMNGPSRQRLTNATTLSCSLVYCLGLGWICGKYNLCRFSCVVAGWAGWLFNVHYWCKHSLCVSTFCTVGLHHAGIWMGSASFQQPCKEAVLCVRTLRRLVTGGTLTSDWILQGSLTRWCNHNMDDISHLCKHFLMCFPYIPHNLVRSSTSL